MWCCGAVVSTVASQQPFCVVSLCVSVGFLHQMQSQKTKFQNMNASLMHWLGFAEKD